MSEKDKKRKYKRERYHMNTDLNEKLKQYQRNCYNSINMKKWNFICFCNIKMSEKTLKFDIVVVNAKKFHTSKKPIVLSLADIDKIEVSDEFKHNDKGSKYFIGDLGDNIIRPLCIILPQISGYMRYLIMVENLNMTLYW